MKTDPTTRLEVRMRVSERARLEELAAAAKQTLAEYLLTRAGVRSAKGEK